MTLARGQNCRLVFPQHDMVLVLTGWNNDSEFRDLVVRLYGDVIEPALGP